MAEPSQSFQDAFRDFVRNREATSNVSAERIPQAPAVPVKRQPPPPSTEANPESAATPPHGGAPPNGGGSADLPQLPPEPDKPCMHTKAPQPPIDIAGRNDTTGLGRMRTLPDPLAKVGGFASASVPSEPKITGRIAYNFPHDFPESSRDTVTTEQNRALLEFNANRWWQRERIGGAAESLRYACGRCFLP